MEGERLFSLLFRLKTNKLSYLGKLLLVVTLVSGCRNDFIIAYMQVKCKVMTVTVHKKHHMMIFLDIKHNLAGLLEKLFFCHNSNIYRVNDRRHVFTCLVLAVCNVLS